jgi:hypothetical protein
VRVEDVEGCWLDGVEGALEEDGGEEGAEDRGGGGALDALESATSRGC